MAGDAKPGGCDTGDYSSISDLAEPSCTWPSCGQVRETLVRRTLPLLEHKVNIWDLLCVYDDIENCEIVSQTKTCGCTEVCTYAFRGFSICAKRCRRDRFHSIPTAKTKCPCALGAGSSVTKGNWPPLFARPALHGDHSCRCQPPCRCTLGDGRRAALQGTVLRYRRDLGRSTCAVFHRDKAVGTQGRGEQFAMLAYPARDLSRSQRRAGPLAHCIASVVCASAQSTGARRAALAGRVIPFAHPSTRHMGGQL